MQMEIVDEGNFMMHDIAAAWMCGVQPFCCPIALCFLFCLSLLSAADNLSCAKSISKHAMFMINKSLNVAMSPSYSLSLHVKLLAQLKQIVQR